MLNDNMDAAVMGVAKGMQYGGGGAAVLFGFNAVEFAAVLAAGIGALIGIAGYITQLHFNRRRDRRDADRAEREEAHRVYMRGLADRER